MFKLFFMPNLSLNFKDVATRNKILVFATLFLIVCFTFFIRIYFCWGDIFSDGVVKYIDDANYHMRFLENMLLGGHFPNFIYFDPFTNFPHGSYSIAPFYDLILAFFIWIITFGKPTLEILNKIAPFYPVILGCFIPVVVYFIAKELWNNSKISLLSAFFVAISKPILYKSLLGANDHHIAEVLFSSIVILFLLKVLKASETGGFFKNKKLWLFAVLTGIFSGFYLLIWNGAIMFFAIIFGFFAIYYISEFVSGRSANWILTVGAVIFVLPFLMMMPFFGHPNLNLAIYNIYHIIFFGFVFLGLFLLWILGFFIKKKSLNRGLIIPFLFLAALFCLLVLQVFSPYIFNKTIALAGGISNNAAFAKYQAKLVSEMRFLKFQGAINDFSSLFFLAILGFIVVVCNFFKKLEPKFLLVIIWGLAVFSITGIVPLFGQTRFNIYFAITVCLLSAFFIVKGLEFGRKGLKTASRLDPKNNLRKYILFGSLSILISLIFLLVYPFPFNAGAEYPESLPDIALNTLKAAGNPFLLQKDWYDTLKWLKEKTPDPDINYYQLYPEPGINKKTGVLNDYSYPEQSYGILTHWSYGHAIVYYAHRMPVANPFQQGIGKEENGKVKELGEAVFFLETNEKTAISYLDQLRARYVITDFKYTDLSRGFFKNMITWVGADMASYKSDDNNSLTKYDESMIVRLHLSDGSQTIIEENLNNENTHLKLGALEHFRILYESETKTNTIFLKNIYKPIKMVKIFEYVKGAKIKGKITSGTEVKIFTEITTNQNRKFMYENQTISAQDGTFEIILPYSIGRQENSDISASEYTIKIGNWTKQIKVSEEDVLTGALISI